MAFDEYLADRISQILNQKKIAFNPKRMMGGLVFMVNSKMCCGIHINKKLNSSLLMAKIGEDAYFEAIKQDHTLPMDFTGRPMKGFIYITVEGIDTEEQLEYWINLALTYNIKMYQ